MGNCQAIDNASIVIQHPNAAKIERLYGPTTAADVMKANPGHHVALLLTTTTVYSSSSAAGGENRTAPLRVTRIKLLRPADALVLGHVYRLVTTQGPVKQERHRSRNNTPSKSRSWQPALKSISEAAI
ncbi:v-type ATP synthase beta chain [Striga asiatica]|uniref:V-type ATP synthase beta chain n=1 Tax=Striga asiatica TaxID=4170 RepID=A0A5A7P2Z2_STRAF|nr:v-type ATP synthase beta chain [Striga asiatica]